LDTTWNTILGRQFGAATDMLDNAMNACRDESWSDPSTRPEWVRRNVVGFWHVAYHTLFFLDLQLAGSAEGWAPPPPFDLSELDPAGRLPERPYTKDELRTYLRHCREKCRATIMTLTEEKACERCQWGSLDLSFGELLLHSMRHVQHHAAQLNLLLRKPTDPAPGWIKRTEVPLNRG
jgi:uncharacterized damage-inducible protein DinB